MLIDQCLPVFDTTVREHLVVDADPVSTWEALVGLDLMRVHTPLLDAAMYVRGVPAKLSALAGREVSPPEEPATLLVGGDGPAMDGWLSLGRVEGEEIAFGAIGRFWQPDIEWYDVAAMSPAEFADFDEEGWGRIAANFTLRPYGEVRTLASYEARTATTDPTSATLFARYWRLVRPFVGHIMRAALTTLADDAAGHDRTPAAVG